MPSHSRPPRDERLVIGITGRIGSGKTSVGKYLSLNYQFQYLRYSQVLSDWLATAPKSKARLQEIGWDVMAGGMQAELNRRLIEQIATDTDVAVDGLRHPIDYESLRKAFASSLHLLYMDSRWEMRWLRLKGSHRYQTLEEFKAADSHPVEQQIELLRGKADAVLSNEGSLESLYVSLDQVIRHFRERTKK